MFTGIRRITSKDRVNRTIDHILPDQLPVDFLAVPEIWNALFLQAGFKYQDFDAKNALYDPNWEKVNVALENDCRVLSYDQFVSPYHTEIVEEGEIDWFGSPSRSTPNRMFRIKTGIDSSMDVWGRHFICRTQNGSTAENISQPPLAGCDDISEVRSHNWPSPDWWDFSNLGALTNSVDPQKQYHWRFRAGSVFEIAWQLFGFEKFLMDLSLQPQLPLQAMEIITEITLELMETVLRESGERIDTIYFYDDVATQENLLISLKMWRQYVKPFHQKIIDKAQSYQKTVMYHCDGNTRKIIPELIEMGVDILNPIQADIPEMDPATLKAEFGGELCFHGGVDIYGLLSTQSPSNINHYINNLKKEMLQNGGFVLAPTHHIQAGTPIENILEMYNPTLREIDHDHSSRSFYGTCN